MISSSKEDLLEMSEATTPIRNSARRPIKRRNQVHSPPFTSPATGAADRDVTSIFSVSRISRRSSSDDTTTEWSDNFISDASANKQEITRKSLSKSSADLHKKTNKISRLKKSLDKLRRETSKVDASVHSVRSRLQLDEQRPEATAFSFICSESEKFQAPAEDRNELVHYKPSGHWDLVFQELNLTKNAPPSPNQLDNPVKLQNFKPPSAPHAAKPSSYSPPNRYHDLEEVRIIKENVLELSIDSVKFYHHPLFSLEHVLQENLQKVFANHSNTLEEKTIEKLLEELDNQRKAQTEQREATLRNVRKARERLFKEARMQRARLKKILLTWKAIKKIRANQGYCSTNIRLIIQKRPLDSIKLEVLFQQILQDLLEEKKAAYEKKLGRMEEGNGDGNHQLLRVDEAKLETELKRKFLECFPDPGEPELWFYLRHDQEISAEVESEPENHRRKAAASTTFTIKISCDSVPVCKSKPSTLNEQFELDISEMFLLQLTTIPQSLTLEIFEHPQGLLRKNVANVTVEIPSLGVLYQEAKNREKQFERHELVHYTHAGVGSGCKLQNLLEDDNAPLDLKELHTRGVLVSRVGWQSAPHRRDPLDQFPSAKPITKWGTVDAAAIQHWLEARRSDPDIELIGLDDTLELWKEDCLTGDDAGSFFRLDANADYRRNFCKIQDIQANLRFQYLKLRDLNEIEFDGITIPNRMRELPINLLTDFKKRKALEVEDDGPDGDPRTLRETGKRRLRQMQKQIFQKCKGLRDNLSYESVVDEKYLIYFEEVVKTLVKNLFNLFRWRPKLSRPLPRLAAEPQQTPALSTHKFLISILRGKNIPQRDGAGDVQSFVEISFEDFFFTSSTKSGKEPAWNEAIELPLKAQHADYLNPDALSGSISFNLFDQTGERDNPRKFWLGEVKVPLAALATGLNLSGWFKVRKAQVLFGYQAQEELVVSRSPKLSSSIEATFIQLDVRVSPILPSLEPSMAELPSNDIPYIKEHVLRWNESFNAAFPSKKVCALAIDVNGRTNCITRFLRPLEPPHLNNEEFDVTPEQCLRYISLIPFTECNAFFQNIWLTSEQLLNFMVGSVTDHCVTLTCFLLALKIDAYLLLVWGNAQRHQSPAFLRFDLSRKSDWWPLFDTNITAPTNFVNNKIHFILYNDFEHLEERVERKLKSKFSKWRLMERTNFNYRVSEAFSGTLRLLELNSMHGKPNNDALLELSKAIGAYQINGAVLNVPFTSLQALVRRVKALNLHIQSPDVAEFGLSVMVQIYPGRVLSVWLFIGRITDIS
ncbi:coiled-coil and C2 domain-containing protein 2A [Dendroctonus ponderosae]|nr:coiled-coil and C2 domain-containing protein 2A [Dendroctonus ponderosae]